MISNCGMRGKDKEYRREMRGGIWEMRGGIWEMRDRKWEVINGSLETDVFVYTRLTDDCIYD